MEKQIRSLLELILPVIGEMAFSVCHAVAKGKVLRGASADGEWEEDEESGDKVGYS